MQFAAPPRNYGPWASTIPSRHFTSQPPSPPPEPDDEWKRKLRTEIERNFQEMLTQAKVRLEEQCRSDMSRKAEFVNEYKQTERQLRKYSEEQYQEKCQYERDLRRSAAGNATPPNYLLKEQQNIMNNLSRPPPREPLDRPDSQSPPLFPRVEDYAPKYSSASASATARVAQSGFHHLRGSSSAGQLANHLKPLSSASRYASREAPAAVPDPNQRKRDEEARKEEERKIREERAVNERMAEEVRARTEVLSHWPVEARSDSSLAFLQAPPGPSDTQDVARRPAMASDDNRVRIGRDMHAGDKIDLLLRQQEELRRQQLELKALAEDLRRREAEVSRREETLRGRPDNGVGRYYQEEMRRRDELLARQLQEDEVRRARRPCIK